MAKNPSRHLDWNANEAIAARTAVLALKDSPGWEFVAESIALLRERLVERSILNVPADATAAQRERFVGTVHGLDLAIRAVDGIIENGDRAEQSLLTREDVAHV